MQYITGVTGVSFVMAKYFYFDLNLGYHLNLKNNLFSVNIISSYACYLHIIIILLLKELISNTCVQHNSPIRQQAMHKPNMTFPACF